MLYFLKKVWQLYIICHNAIYCVIGTIIATIILYIVSEYVFDIMVLPSRQGVQEFLLPSSLPDQTAIEVNAQATKD